MPKSNLKLCVIDNAGGNYIPLAIQLSKYFTETGYYSSQQSPFPKLSLSKVATGYKEIEKINDFWSQVDNYDLFLFPDIYFQDWGTRLRKMGKLVIGGSPSEQIEINRQLFKELLERVDLPSAPTQFITGIKALRRFLKQKRSNDSYVKISAWRGEMETFGHKNWAFSEIFVDELEHKLGPLSESAEFIVEDGIEGNVVETGYDGYSVYGKYPEQAIYGIEIKDAGYLGKKINYNELPQPVLEVNTKFSTILKAYQHQSFFSTEIRYDMDNILAYFTDPTLRAPNPPSNVMLRLINNWNEILPAMAKGEIVNPTFEAEYGVELILKSPYANDNYLPIQFPPEYKNNISIKCSFMVDDNYYIIPIKDAGYDMTEIMSVTVIGNDYNQIMEEALNIADQVQAYQLTYDTAALDKAKEQIQKLEDNLGIKF